MKKNRTKVFGRGARGENFFAEKDIPSQNHFLYPYPLLFSPSLWLWEKEVSITGYCGTGNSPLPRGTSDRGVRGEGLVTFHLKKFSVCPIKEKGYKTITTIFLLGAFFLSPGCFHRDPSPFDSRRAFDILETQVRFGTREPGSPAHSRTLHYLERELSKYADRTSLQPFQQRISGIDSSLELTNIIANFQPNKRKRVLLCAHWDTRPIADRDPNPENRNTPIPGANDGASGVAVLLEIARLFKEKPPRVGIDIVFFDGEDSGQEGNPDEWFLGSKYFARQFGGSYRPIWGILIDMIGDRDLVICRETNSEKYQPTLVDRIWKTAEKMGIDSFQNCQRTVADDHLPLNEAGIPCIDIIDIDYPYWHTMEDTPDKCSPESLEKVGHLLVRLVYEER